MKLELVEIISVEVDLPGDCVILDLIIPPGKFKKEDNDIDKPKSHGRHIGSNADEWCEEK